MVTKPAEPHPSLVLADSDLRGRQADYKVEPADRLLRDLLSVYVTVECEK